jgi:hypothetical protein
LLRCGQHGRVQPCPDHLGQNQPVNRVVDPLSGLSVSLSLVFSSYKSGKDVIVGLSQQARGRLLTICYDLISSMCEVYHFADEFR